MIYVLGATTVDQIIYVDHLAVSQEDQKIERMEFNVGGCAYNVAKTIGDCTLVSPVGTGMFGQMVRNHANFTFHWIQPERNIDNGVCVCLVEPDGERTFLAYQGAEFEMGYEAIDQIQSTDWVYFCGLDLERPTSRAVIQAVAKTGAHLFFAPGSRVLYCDWIDEILNLHPIVHLNMEESKVLGGMEKIFEQTKSLVIVTDGKNGSFAYDGTRYFEPSTPIRPLNTIGAGDTHAGVCLKSLGKQIDVRTMLRDANEASYKFLLQKK